MKKIWENGNLNNLETLRTGAGSSLISILLFSVIVGVVCYSMYVLISGFSPTLRSRTQTKAKISWYWPPLLGTNCSMASDDKCISRMASGLPWENWVGKAVACPEEFPFGTVFIIDGRRWVCLDRGGAISRINETTIWLDMLVSEPLYRYGTIRNVFIVKK